MRARIVALLPFLLVPLAGCGGGGSGGTAASSVAAVAVAVATQPPGTQPVTASAGSVRHGFVGAFFRPVGAPPFGVFSTQSPGVAPSPYPVPGTSATEYCHHVAANGSSIESGYLIDAIKLADITNLGVGWTRLGAPAFFDDQSHVFGAGHYAFGDFDSDQCNTLVDHGIVPIIGLEAGPVEYNATPGQFSPVSVPQYQTAADFGQWCGVVAAHERSAFPAVTQFSLPGNEVNANPQLFPGGEPQIAAYSQACYAAIKAANPSAFVYGFELNMDGSLDVPGFIRAMAALGCVAGTCYDGIALHLSLVYPAPPAGTPCFPNPGGQADMQCVTDVENAAHVTHVLISEIVYPVPAGVPDEATKARATVAAFNAYAANPTVDGVLYANVDECAFYPTGFFAGGCLISTTGAILPAYTALQQLAGTLFFQ